MISSLSFLKKKNYHIYKKKKDIAKRTYFDNPYLQIFNRKSPIDN